MPYTAVYSSNFVPGKPSDVLAVLNNYKAWQDNDMATLRATIGDSITMIFSSGMVMNTTGDSAVKEAKKYGIVSPKLTLLFMPGLLTIVLIKMKNG
ncbi:MAG: hypothetical protein WDM78_19660 [Puia sp.]